MKISAHTQALRRQAIEAAPELRSQLTAVEAGPDPEKYVLDLLDAVPASPSSHQERGAIGRALIESLAQVQPSLAIQIANQAIGGAAFWTSFSGFAESALRAPRAERPSELAELGLAMMDTARPYPSDQTAAGQAVLKALLGGPHRPELQTLAEQTLEKMDGQEFKVQAALSRVALARILQLDTQAAEVEALVSGPSAVHQIDILSDVVVIDGIELEIASVTR
ncbi:MAG: hypothetical protein KC910_16250 [Candidatus Eremiobacteraeota bacterium]|nr:hypothetical protein [Candidatus Eremiobacteraeota bacterium]